jgi:hypothetical protein
MTSRAAKMLITLHWSQPNGTTLYDEMRIVPTSATHYDVRFDQSSVACLTTFEVEGKKLPIYLSIFLSTILADRNKPFWIQIDAPMYPCVLLKAEDLIPYSTVLSAQLDSLQEDWPMEVVG